jgi:hypothetical protein
VIAIGQIVARPTNNNTSDALIAMDDGSADNLHNETIRDQRRGSTANSRDGNETPGMRQRLLQSVDRTGMRMVVDLGKGNVEAVTGADLVVLMVITLMATPEGGTTTDSPPPRPSEPSFKLAHGCAATRHSALATTEMR